MPHHLATTLKKVITHSGGKNKMQRTPLYDTDWPLFLVRSSFSLLGHSHVHHNVHNLFYSEYLIMEGPL